MASKNTSYFEQNYEFFNIWGKNNEGFGLRECQLGAYWATWAHFTTSDLPALISLPTGSGKTALMMILAFGLKAERVLIITPAEILRGQIKEEFSTFQILKDIGILKNVISKTNVFSVDNQLIDISAWENLRQYDVVTATPKTTSPGEANVCKPPEDLFDLVFIDEAHHVPAPTWKALFDSFKKSKCILLTATPFRRDRKRIPAHLIYHYSIKKAIDSGIYRPVTYIAVKGKEKEKERDKEICKSVKKIFNDEKKKNYKPKLIIRSERVEKANVLVKRYKKVGIKTECVNYTKPYSENRQVLDDLKNDKIDGIVCVGMLGEGLDLPDLNIAVLHHAPRSLPFTIQFVGRVSRVTSNNCKEAYLISVPDEVRGEMRKLHRRDANWRKLIPKLCEIVIGGLSDARHFKTTKFGQEIELNPIDIMPFFSVRVYKANEEVKQSLLEPISFDIDDLFLSYSEVKYDSLLIAITESIYQPPWAKETGINENHYHLHLFYYSDSGFLFESTTSEEISKKIREKIIDSEHINKISMDKIIGALKEAKGKDYFMVGLKNVLGRGYAQPGYKTFLGRNVQPSVRPTDGNTFAPGHALVKISEEETRGISTFQSRIWAIKRKNIEEFKEWCEKITEDLNKGMKKFGLPGLMFLAEPIKINKIDERPLACLIDEKLFTCIKKIKTDENEKYELLSINPSMNITGFNTSTGIIKCNFIFSEDKEPLEIQYNSSNSDSWSIVNQTDFYIRLEFSDNEIYDYSTVDKLFKEFPPSFVMPNGGVIIENNLWKPQRQKYEINREIYNTIDWSGCDTTKEVGTADVGLKNILEWVEDKLKNEIERDDILIKDHGKGELADFIVIKYKNYIRKISFYHCKKMNTTTPGDSVSNAYEVLGQACRSGYWSLNPRLMHNISEHIANRSNTRIITGRQGSINSLKRRFESNSWQYETVIVQPGFKCDEIQNGKKIYSLILATYEYLKNNGNNLLIWGS